MGKKGGEQTTTSKIELDPAVREAALQNLDIANEVASIGYIPYQGNTVAGFSPQQMSAMQSTDQAMSAFGMPSAVNWQQQGGQFQAPRGMDSNSIYQALTGMQAPTDDGSGMVGHNATPAYNNALSQIPAAQMAAIQSFLMNPQTGAAPTNRSVPAPRTQYGQTGNGGVGVTGGARRGGNEDYQNPRARSAQQMWSQSFNDRLMNK